MCAEASEQRVNGSPRLGIYRRAATGVSYSSALRANYLISSNIKRLTKRGAATSNKHFACCRCSWVCAGKRGDANLIYPYTLNCRCPGVEDMRCATRNVGESRSL